MIEYNLANILSMNEIISSFDEKESMYVCEYNELVEKAEEWYKKLDKGELGKLLSNMKNKEIVTEEFIYCLDEIREERNYYIHNVFKEDLFTKEFQNNPKQFIPKLQKLVSKMNVVNDMLIKKLSDMKEIMKFVY